ncbi:hypothetical protein BDV23DRAFT_193235 [Aspergillus alliaceus]|uniref:Protein kinase domain-containing protein n=1 Tax=Petromyces alliaceus TaxID=209559 RepID=A0A5N7CBM0_PETAA|nr:hypothetical protein BDV23DRAFT_193235 [Aspergillus alliaceus]
MVIELCSGADAIMACRKIEGNFLIFTMNNAQQIVARIPFHSEVATIRYLQTKTSLPILMILDWSDDVTGSSNAVCCQYIVTEHAPGAQLHKKWPEIAGDQRVRCIATIYWMLKGIADQQFPAFGSLYFTNSLVSSASRWPVDKKFCVGPHCETRYSDCSVGEQRYYHIVKPNCGPRDNFSEYSDGLIDCLSKLPPGDSGLGTRPMYHRSTRSHKRLLVYARAVLKEMDYWGQAACIEPAFWYSDEAFDITSQYNTPILANPRLMNENLFRLFRYSHRTRRDGEVALRYEMIDTARHWKELRFAGRCPYPLPAPKELMKHEKEYKLFEVAQDLNYELANLLNVASDGWMLSEAWEETDLAHRRVFTGMAEAVLTNQTPGDCEPVRDKKTLWSIWPFDIPSKN